MGWALNTYAISDPSVRAAYVHVPFCRRRCGYCSFTVVAGRDDLIAPYLTAIERELSWLESPCEVDTLFFGGGTPAYLSADQLRRLFAATQRWLPLAAGHEASLEANPADLDAERLAVMTEFGINRVSLGVQSFDSAKLAILERDHRRPEIDRALELCRRQFDSMAIDLIVAAPGESLAGWQADLHQAIAAGVDHVSTYGLTY